MPLNMNTVGTGNGSVASNSDNVLTLLGNSIEPKINPAVSVNGMTSISFNYYHAYIEYSSKKPTIDIKFKGEYYGRDSSDLDFYKISLVENGSNSINLTYTKINAPFRKILDMEVCGDYLYIVGSTDPYVDDDTIDTISMYRFDGTQITKITNALTSIPGLYNTTPGCTWSMYKILYTPSEGFYFTLGSGQLNVSSWAYHYPNIAICRITETNGFEVLCSADGPSSSWAMNASTKSWNSNPYSQQISSVMGNYSPSNRCLYPLSIEISDNLIELYVTYIGILNGGMVSNGPVTIQNTTHQLRFIKTSEWELSFTEVSSENIISFNTTPNNSSTGWDRADKTHITEYPLLYDFNVSSLIMIDENITASYNSSASKPINIYITNHESKRTLFKKISCSQKSTDINGGYPMYEGLIDFNSDKPLICTKNWDDTVIIKYITVDGLTYENNSSCDFVSYFEAGDKCSTKAGFIHYEYDSNIVQLNDATLFTIETPGIYRFRTKTYDAYKSPDFIIETRDGSLLNTRVLMLNDTDISCYLQKGMDVSGQIVPKDGYNEIRNAIVNGRIKIKR